jgi:soluble lytic murein transglycosylase-like protein
MNRKPLPHLLWLCLLAAAWASAVPARADQLHLRDGRVIEAEEVWEMGDELWFRQGKLISSVAKAEVLRVARPKPATAAAPSPAAAGNSAKPAEAAPRTVTRIVLKGGATIDADTVWEDGELIGYLLGNMQAFVERAAVEKVLRGVTPGEMPVAPSANLRYTTGHAGLDQLIERNAARHGLDPLLIYLVMREESGFNYRAVSRAGARGLMQLMPATARRLGVRNIHDPGENVEAGARYLKNLIELFAGDVNLALAAYNAGEGAVARYGYRVPPYRETQNYVRRINAAYRRATGSGQAAASGQP